MKKKLTTVSAALLAMCLISNVSAASNNTEGGSMGLLFALIGLIGVTLLAIIISIVLTFSLVKASRRSKHGRMKASFKVLIACAYLVALIALVCTLVCGSRYNEMTADPTEPSGSTSQNDDTEETPSPSESGDPTGSGTAQTTQPSETTQPTETEPTEPTNSLGDVTYGDTSKPSNHITSYDIFLDGSIVDSYNRAETITFGDPNKESYFALPGIATFRGDNYRTGSAYGTVNLVENTMTSIWTQKIGSLPKGSSSGANSLLEVFKPCYGY